MATQRREQDPVRGAPKLRASVAELRALAHPLRLRILELFAKAPRTTMQVAELIGQPPTRLYHHVNALERAGLLRLRETRPNRGTVEKWYEAVLPRLTSRASAARSGRGVSSLSPSHRSLALALIEQAGREVRSALAHPEASELPVAVRVIAGSPARIAAIRRRLREFLRDLRRDAKGGRSVRARRAPNAEQQRWALTISFAPAWPEASEPSSRAPAGDRE
jgi:DNA-binding transcriptional ArsR family regulator